MLTPISESTLTDTDRAAALVYNCLAVDVQTGAYLFQSAGQWKNGLLKFILVLPHETPADRGGVFGERRNMFAVERAVIPAWSIDEAIDVANKRLPGMMRRAKIAQHKK